MHGVVAAAAAGPVATSWEFRSVVFKFEGLKGLEFTYTMAEGLRVWNLGIGVRIVEFCGLGVSG